MSDGGRVTKRPQTPAQKAAKQRTDVERAGKIKMYFSRFTGNYYSGYRANLAQIAALLNLADEQESTKLLEHMRDLADASWTGCRKPFSDMAKSERVAAFKTMIQDESHPLDLCVFTKDGPGLDKKRVALRTIFSKGLFSVGDWPEGTDEVDDQTLGTVISVVRSWFHAGISAGTNHWKGQSKAAAEKYKAKQRHPRADESYEQETGDIVHPKRKWTDAQSHRKRAKVGNKSARESSDDDSHQSQSPVSHVKAEVPDVQCMESPAPLWSRMAVFQYEDNQDLCCLRLSVCAKAGIEEVKTAADRDGDLIVAVVHKHWDLDPRDALAFDGYHEKRILDAIEKAAGKSEGTLHLQIESEWL